MVKRIDRLTPAQEARFGEWVERWTAIGLSTERMDLERFKAGARAAYGFAGLDQPRVIVPVSSPLVLALAAPTAAVLLAQKRDDAVGDAVGGAVGGAVDVAVRDAVRDAVGDAVGGAVGGAVRGAVRGAVDVAVRGAVGGAVGGAVDVAVRDAVRDAVGGAVRVAVSGAVDVAVDVAVRGAVDVAVRDAVRGAVDVAVRGAVRGAVGDAVGGAVGGAVRGAVDVAVDVAVRDAVRVAVDVLPASTIKAAIARLWPYLIGGQFWVGGWWWYGSPAMTSFFREVCGLTLPGDIEERAKAYQATAASACWWWPHRQFVMVSDRPTHIHRDERGRLHSETETAVGWPDGWGVWAWHGVRVPEWAITTPAAAISVEQVMAEANAEVRRVLIERMSWERLIAGRQPAHADDWGQLYRIAAGDTEYAVVKVVNASPEPDGSYRDYLLRVPPAGVSLGDRCVACRAILDSPETAHAAVAWTFHQCVEHYAPAVQT